jgi:hypothetical protein
LVKGIELSPSACLHDRPTGKADDEDTIVRKHVSDGLALGDPVCITCDELPYLLSIDKLL